MKALVTPKPVPKYAKPSSMLGFVLCALVILTITLCIWQFSLNRGTSFKLKGEHLLAAVGLTVAVWVGLLAAWVSLHSSIRQHTITTLLDSRLSETYMKYADTLSKHYSDYETRLAANPALKERPTDKVDILALRYILNYFEFISIGVLKGDFDEGTLRDSLRSILRKNATMSMAWIRLEQSKNPRLYVNLMWLFHRWE